MHKLWNENWRLKYAILFRYIDHQINDEKFETYADNVELNLDTIVKNNSF